MSSAGAVSGITSRLSLLISESVVHATQPHIGVSPHSTPKLSTTCCGTAAVQHRTRKRIPVVLLYIFIVVCFAFFFFPFFFFLFFSLFLWSGLFCCVLVPGTLALHLLYVDELRLFGLLCFTSSQSVTREFAPLQSKMNQHGLWVY